MWFSRHCYPNSQYQPFKTTRIHAQTLVQIYENITYNRHPITKPSCNHRPGKTHIPKLRPIKLSKIKSDGLNIAEHKLNQYSKQLDKIIHRSFIKKHYSLFTIVKIILIIALILLYTIFKCKKKRNPRIWIVSVMMITALDHPNQVLTTVWRGYSQAVDPVSALKIPLKKKL